MNKTLHLSCQCGSVTGELSGMQRNRGDYMHCYCIDCQTAAHYLDKGDAVLDKNGGTAMFITTPAGLTWITGEENIACFRLSPKGPLRWFANCCNTPLVNTTGNPEFPFLSVQGASFSSDEYELLGKLKSGIQAQSAYGDTRGLDACQGNPGPIGGLKLMFRFAKAKLKGEQKRSVMFDRQTRQPIAEPYILSREERATAKARCGS